MLCDLTALLFTPPFPTWIFLLKKFQERGKIKADIEVEQVALWIFSSVNYGSMFYQIREPEKAKQAKIKAYTKMLVREFTSALTPEK